MDIILASYTDPLEAQIALGRLQAEGIDARLDDAHSVLANWEWRLAIGGAKLRVPEAQAARAREVLAAIEAGAFALDDIADDDGAPLRAPDRESLSGRVAWLVLMLFNIPLPWRRRRDDSAVREL
ncbi:DUF2007 domain-containing protein [Luteimonas yindakuii]|uniref:DUF2007 domain-containing protein n=1 Tax=Luteimonas yindakuii TaxID=2565782 RepID=A0A4Z1R936_9GAMM|nr:DUF2007 domain-containing protein [Luteimonas yindakuii]TKS55115.1 DUF2007 domain-containing protein [Luteimonas yindakuii]